MVGPVSPKKGVCGLAEIRQGSWLPTTLEVAANLNGCWQIAVFTCFVATIGRLSKTFDVRVELQVALSVRNGHSHLHLLLM